MGAAVGHLQHIIEAHHLTFDGLKEILTTLFNGNVEVFEKCDGINLVFTWDVETERLRVARKASDIAHNGIGIEELSSRFAGRENVEKAFVEAFKALSIAVQTLTNEEKLAVFGPSAYRWFSAEVIHHLTPNTIHYDGNHIVFHNWPVFERTPMGVVKKSQNTVGVGILTSAVHRMSNALRETGFVARGPVNFNLMPVVGSSELTDALAVIELMENTISVVPQFLPDVKDLRTFMCEQARSELGLSSSMGAERELMLKLVDHPDALHANVIKKMWRNKSQLPWVTDLMQRREQLQDKWLRPIERSIYHVSVAVLKQTASAFVKDPLSEVRRLRECVRQTCEEIMRRRDPKEVQYVSEKLELLEDISNVSSSMEGIVFFRGSEAFKITGAFAPAHQIIALLKYGRKGINTDERKCVQGHEPDIIRRA